MSSAHATEIKEQSFVYSGVNIITDVPAPWILAASILILVSASSILPDSRGKFFKIRSLKTPCHISRFELSFFIPKSKELKLFSVKIIGNMKKMRRFSPLKTKT
jgi:hypothetical protein